MILFPYKKVVIETEMSEKEFLNAFEGITLEANVWSNISEFFKRENGKYFFVGKASNKNIKFRLLNTLEYLYALCKIKRKENLTMIELVFETTFFDKLSALVWVSMIAILTIETVSRFGYVLLPICLLSIIPFLFFKNKFNSTKIELMTNKIIEISNGKLCKK